MGTKIASLYAEIGADTKKLEKGLGDSKKQIEGVGGSFKDLKSVILPAMAAATAAVVLFKKGIEFTREGAALQRVEESSASLASSMGMDMDDILVAVRKASKGMVADTDIMASASRALLLGVGGSAEQMGKLMEVAAVRGRAMGLSTTQAFNDIVTGIGRNSRMILDNLGIVLDLEDTYKKYSVELGKNADQLTETEKKQAMMNAVIESTAPLLEETGGLVIDNAANFERLDAAVANTTDRFKKQISEALAPAVGTMATNLEARNKLIDAEKRGIITSEEYTELIKYMSKFGNTSADTLVLLKGKTEDWNNSLKFANQDMGYQIDLLMRSGMSADEARKALGLLTKAEEDLETATLLAAEAQGRFKDNLGFVKDALKNSGIALEEHTLLSDLLALSSGDLTLEQIAQRDAIEEATRAYENGILTAPEYVAALEDIAAGAAEVETAAGKASAAVWTISDALNGLPREVRTDILINTYRYETDMPTGTQPSRKNKPKTKEEEEELLDDLLASGGLARAAAGASINTSAVVGERGPEVAFMPNGTRIISHHDAIKALGNESGNNMDISKLLIAFKTAIKELKTGETNYNLSMPTTANPEDVGMAFEMMRAYGGN